MTKFSRFSGILLAALLLPQLYFVVPVLAQDDKVELRPPIGQGQSQGQTAPVVTDTAPNVDATDNVDPNNGTLTNSNTSAPNNASGKIPPPPRGPLPKPAANATLEDLYPTVLGNPKYGASSSDPALTEKQKVEAEQVQIAPTPISELLPIGNGKLPPIQLEASFNEPISLKRVLEITLENNLPIRISQAGFDSQRYLFYGSLGNFLPDLIMTYRGQRTDTQTSSPNDIYTKSTTVRFPVYEGGRAVYGAMAALYRQRAAKDSYYASVNDALLDAYRNYYTLLLNQSLLQIRVKSVELSRTQLKLNEQLKAAGVGTNFAIYQSRTQLALDKQALLAQQVLVRQSALALARTLNTSMVINYIPAETVVRELKLIDPNLDVQSLISNTLKLRPELKQFENLRMAANRNIQVAASPLYPTFQFFTSITGSKSGRSNSSGSGLSGSTVIIPTGGSGASIGISGSGSRSLSAGFDLSWSIPSMGLPDAFNTLSARALARQAMLQSNLTYNNVMYEVRASYLNMLTAKEQVKVAAEAVVSATEQLRLANLRVTYGQGINLELIQAQQVYVTALTNHVQAVINYNITQAQLLRDTGQISLDTLTHEVPQPISLNKK